jgi:hypothetical protein
MTEKTITIAQINELAHEFGYNARSIRAVLAVEAPRGGFLPDGRVTILFERHIFHKLLKKPLVPKRLDICNPKPGGYEGGEGEWHRLEAAMAIERQAALKSASWGKGQVMGFNHLAAGFACVDHMVDAFAESELHQVRGMLNFIKKNRSLDFVMKSLKPGLAEWVIFAAGYNGKEYAKNNYHQKLPLAYTQAI